MIQQGDLFERVHARRTDPQTSHQAAASIGSEVSRLESLVVEALRKMPSGLTTHELAERLRLSLVTVSPRMRPLVNKGKVRDSGRKHKSASGRKRIIWVAVG